MCLIKWYTLLLLLLKWYTFEGHHKSPYFPSKNISDIAEKSDLATKRDIFNLRFLFSHGIDPLDFTRPVPFPLNIFLFGWEMESIWTNTRKRRSESRRWKNRRTNIPMFFMICWPTYPVGSACLARKIVYVRSIFRLVFCLLPLSMVVDENIHRVRIFKQILFIRWTSTMNYQTFMFDLFNF